MAHFSHGLAAVVCTNIVIIIFGCPQKKNIGDFSIEIVTHTGNNQREISYILHTNMYIWKMKCNYIIALKILK